MYVIEECYKVKINKGKYILKCSFVRIIWSKKKEFELLLIWVFYGYRCGFVFFKKGKKDIIM